QLMCQRYLIKNISTSVEDTADLIALWRRNYRRSGVVIKVIAVLSLPLEFSAKGELMSNSKEMSLEHVLQRSPKFWAMAFCKQKRYRQVEIQHSLEECRAKNGVFAEGFVEPDCSLHSLN